jgi:hypothetical protein
LLCNQVLNGLTCSPAAILDAGKDFDVAVALTQKRHPTGGPKLAYPSDTIGSGRLGWHFLTGAVVDRG